MLDRFSRTQLVFGKEAMDRLKGSRVAVFGVGGVGGYTVEALARSGVGAIDIIDNDKVCLTNINRQIIATTKTVGKYKVDPTAFEVADIYKTSVCPLARVMRYELKRRGIKKLKVVYSKEKPIPPIADEDPNGENGCLSKADKVPGKRQVPGSTAFVPSVAGLIIAGEVIKDIIGYKAVNEIR